MKNNTSSTVPQRTPCEIWTRVMGYFRPVTSFNIGKKSEHMSRKHFQEIQSSNSKFCKQYSSCSSQESNHSRSSTSQDA